MCGRGLNFLLEELSDRLEEFRDLEKLHLAKNEFWRFNPNIIHAYFTSLQDRTWNNN
jgi:hypothetical protein